MAQPQQPNYNPYVGGGPVPTQAPRFQQPPMGQPPKKKKKKKRGAGFYIGITIAALAIIAAAIFIAFAIMNSTQESNRGGQAGQLEGKTEAEIIAELNKVVEEGMFNISIASVVQYDTPTSDGEIKIENSPANRYLMQVYVTLDDTGEVVYTSPILEPNYHIQTAPLDKPLPEGNYKATAVFHALDPETEAEIGQAAAQLTLQVGAKN